MKNSFELSSNKNTKEIIENTFKEAVDKIKDNGYRFHAQQHDENGRDPKIYHTSKHLQILESRARQMAEVLHLTPEQRAIINMTIAWHDTVIEYDEADPNNILAMIRRRRGAREGDKPKESEGNEGKSAQLLEQEMRKVNKRERKKIFTNKQIQIVRWAIDATYPDINLGSDFKGAAFKEYPYYNIVINQNSNLGNFLNKLKTQGVNKGPLFFQPHLEKPLEDGQKIPKEVLIVALSDLGAAGFAEKEAFFKEGDDEMRELYGNLRKPEIILRLIKGDMEVDQGDRQKVSLAFLGWLDSQPGFVAWQALRFEKILYLLRQQENITSEKEQGLRIKFSHFEDNIKSTYDRAKELRSQFQNIQSTRGEKAAFLYLTQNLHYEI